MNPDQPPTPAATPSGLYIRLADAIVAIGAIIILLFSWAPFAKPRLETRSDPEFHASLYSWLSPIGIFVLLAVLLLIATAVIDSFWHRGKQMVGLHRHHVQVGLALFVLVDIFGMMLADPFSSIQGFGDVLSTGYGGILMFLGALVAAAGAVLNHFNLLQGPLTLPKPAPAVAYPPAGGAPGYAPPTQAVTQADVPNPNDPAAN